MTRLRAGRRDDQMTITGGLVRRISAGVRVRSPTDTGRNERMAANRVPDQSSARIVVWVPGGNPATSPSCDH